MDNVFVEPPTRPWYNVRVQGKVRATEMATFRQGNVCNAVLSPEQVVQIYLKGNSPDPFVKQTQRALAREFGVSIGTIGRILRGEAWLSVTAGLESQVIDASLSTEEILAKGMGLDRAAQESQERLLRMLEEQSAAPNPLPARKELDYGVVSDKMTPAELLDHLKRKK